MTSIPETKEIYNTDGIQVIVQGAYIIIQNTVTHKVVELSRKEWGEITGLLRAQ